MVKYTAASVIIWANEVDEMSLSRVSGEYHPLVNASSSSPRHNAAEFNIAEFLVARDGTISLGATRRCLARRVRHRTGIDNARLFPASRRLRAGRTGGDDKLQCLLRIFVTGIVATVWSVEAEDVRIVLPYFFDQSQNAVRRHNVIFAACRCGERHPEPFRKELGAAFAILVWHFLFCAAE